MGLRYKIVYRKCVENRAADALSRVDHGDLLALSVAQPTVTPKFFMAKVLFGFTQDLFLVLEVLLILTQDKMLFT